MPWQSDTIDDAMSERADGKWLCRDVAIIVARQNGKGSILEARQLAGLFLLGEKLQVHTAHEFKTAYEHFRRVVALVESSDEFTRHVKIIRTGAGDQSIELHNGNRIRFLARSGKSGRGFTGDVVYLDEAFHLDFATVGAIMPTLRSRPNPQIWYTSSAPHATSTVLHSLRRRAMEDEEDRLYLAEWGNPVGTARDDRRAWMRANPSMGIPPLSLTESVMADEMTSLCASPEGQAEFDRELLGIPEDPPPPKGSDVKITLDAWSHCGEAPATWSSARVAEGQPVVLAVSAPTDRSTASVTMAGYRSDGLVHIEDLSLDDDGNVRPGVSWLKVAIPRMAKAWGTGLVTIVMDPKDPAASIVAEVEAELGEKLQRVTLERFAASCVDFVDMVHEGRVRHRGEWTYAESVAGLRVRTIGDGGLWLWDRLTSMSNPAPIISATLAVASLPAAVAARAPKPAETWAY